MAAGWQTARWLVAETDVQEVLDTSGFTLLDERDYGETRLRFLTMETA